MSTLQIEGLWQFIQTMSLSKKNRQWLAARLLDNTDTSTVRNHAGETEHITSSPEMMRIIAEGDEQIKSGNFTTTPIDSLWS